MERTIVAGAIGNCVHVAGVVGFLRIAEELGYATEFLGAAVSIDDFISAVREHDPDIVGISYRLTPDVAERILIEMREKLEAEGLADKKFVFGGTPPVCETAERMGWFDHCFSGLENPQEVWSYLGHKVAQNDNTPKDTLLEMLDMRKPYPLLRHHFGLPSLEETIAGVRKIAESGVLDVISIAPDQNAQESMFRLEEMDPALDGAGGVPVRSAEDLHNIYLAGRHGNHPLFRIYSGTRDLIKWAELATETINNAWGAVPLCWYSALDGRSSRTPEEAIRENQETMEWYADKGIPVEVNESHHWSMRDAHDTIAVVTAYLAAYNAKQMGVRNYVAQYMFNSPPGTHGAMDLAKMLAKLEMIESLHDDGFTSIRQVRAGLLHLSPKMHTAKGQLAASTMLAMQLRTHVIHVVGFCEGDHAATADDVIESCEIVHGVLKNTMVGIPDMTIDPFVQSRKQELLAEADTLLNSLLSRADGSGDPLTSPKLLAWAIKKGILDAPHLRGNAYAAGKLQTRIINGAVHAYDPVKKRIISEEERLTALLGGYGQQKVFPIGKHMRTIRPSKESAIRSGTAGTVKSKQAGKTQGGV